MFRAQIHGNDTVFQTTVRLSRWLVRKWNAAEKPHPCKNRKDGPPNFKGEKAQLKRQKSFRRIRKREMSHRALCGPNRWPENLSKDTNERKH
jgi:hypothetical protein